ncbi:MAG: calcium/sodium antiporter [Pseudomonadota bacterium]|nr:calcium/sodium antiporter [Pseudomonadota bacterium]
MWYDLTIILISFAVMAWSSDLFVDAAIAIADHLHMPKVIIGTVLVGFTTAVPELLVSLDAALNNASGIAIGNALGSYTINIALVLGITAIICPIKVSKSILQREVPVMALSLVISFMLMLDGYFGITDGLILLICLIVTVITFTIIVLRASKSDILQKAKIDIKYSHAKAWLYLVIGLLLLIFSARILTNSSVSLAHYFGVSDLVIGLTIVAIGTSLPELAASIAGVRKGEDDIAIGNVIGSNVLGLFAVLAMPALFSPGSVSQIIIYRDFAFMAFTTLAFWLACYCFDGDKLLINRREGALGVLIFLVYIALLYTIPG